MLSKFPEEDEIKEAVFSLSPHNTTGQDGFNGTFVQSCWKIIEREVIAFVKYFFKGKGLTKFYSHTCLVLIPKIDNHATFSDFRPISLSNFTNKIISKIVSLRVNTLLHKIVSLNQSDFIKDRLISENILLAEEIVHNISHCNHGGNIIIKLDMAKEYDRIDWDFVICRLKQGDPLSPTLFIIATEVLSRSLNSLYRNPNFTPFSMPPNIPRINHLAYADDIVIFYSGGSTSIKLVINVIDNYERSSSQLVVHLYTLSTTTPPKGVFRLIKNYFANFSWGSSEDHKKYHWSFRNHLSLPLDEGGIGIRKMEDISNISHLVSKKLAPGNSHAWSHVLKMRDIAENHIVWKVNSGSSNFQWDNWSHKGPLAKQFPDTPKNFKSLVREFISDGQWNTNKLKELLPDHLVQQIQIIPIGNQNKEDQSFWALSDNGKFGDQKSFNKYRLKQQIAWSIETAVNKAYPNCGLKLPWNSFCDILTRGEGKIGLGGAIRDEYGDIIMAFSIPVIAKNHNIAEAQVALVGLNWCKQNGFNQAILELDSLYIVEILRKDSNTNYKLSHIVIKIKETISMLNIQINHCYREANQLLDSLAKRAVETQQPSHFYSSHQLSRQAKGLLLLDKDQIPCIRNKYDKANFFVS
ncbi:uncharacterized protein [Nicotiana tomentosiformis]|uniref:uncharacterized protein n=1 Tax=Nicotiana tomentosiformis TaxID=4098 RepID=UPI00388C45BB